MKNPVRRSYALDTLREIQTLPPLKMSTLDFATLEQIAPSFPNDSELESFLVRNELTAALAEYRAAQQKRLI